MSLQERPRDPSVGPKRSEMADRGAVLTYIPPASEEERASRAVETRAYVNRWALKYAISIEDEQEVLAALGVL